MKISVKSMQFNRALISKSRLIKLAKYGTRAVVLRDNLLAPYLGEKHVPACLKRSERYFRMTFLTQEKDLTDKWAAAVKETEIVILRRMRAKQRRKARQHRK